MTETEFLTKLPWILEIYDESLSAILSCAMIEAFKGGGIEAATRAGMDILNDLDGPPGTVYEIAA